MNNNDFIELIKTIDLNVIQPLKVEYERKNDISQTDNNINLHWSMKFPENTFEIIDNKLLQLYPMFEVDISCKDKVIYSHRAIIGISFEINDFSLFEKKWKDEKIQEIFRNKQVLKLVWPFFRQQVSDGLSRVGLPTIALPLVV